MQSTSVTSLYKRLLENIDFKIVYNKIVIFSLIGLILIEFSFFLFKINYLKQILSIFEQFSFLLLFIWLFFELLTLLRLYREKKELKDNFIKMLNDEVKQ